MVICLERGADLHMSQLMPLPLTVSSFSKIQTGFTFLVPAGQKGVRVCVSVCVCVARTSSDSLSLLGSGFFSAVSACFSLPWSKFWMPDSISAGTRGCCSDDMFGLRSPRSRCQQHVVHVTLTTVDTTDDRTVCNSLSTCVSNKHRCSRVEIRALACGTSGKNRRASLVCVCCDFTSDLLVAYSCFPNIYRNSTESPEERSKLVYLKRACSRVTSASSALGVLNDYALYKSTHSLTHSVAAKLACGSSSNSTALTCSVCKRISKNN